MIVWQGGTSGDIDIDIDIEGLLYNTIDGLLRVLQIPHRRGVTCLAGCGGGDQPSMTVYPSLQPKMFLDSHLGPRTYAHRPPVVARGQRVRT